MKSFLISSCLLIGLCAPAQKNLLHEQRFRSKTNIPSARTAQTQWSSCLLDSSYYSDAGGANGLSIKTIYTYNTNRELTFERAQNLQSNVWTDSYHTSYIYNAANEQTSSHKLVWDPFANAWANSRIDSFTTSSNHSQHLALVWDVSGNAWVNSDRTSTTYDNNNRAVTQLYEIWNTTSNTWSTSALYTYTYSASGNLMHELVQGSNNVNTKQYLYTYASATLTQIVGQNWNGSWQNSSRSTLTITNGQMTGALYESWNTSSNSWASTDKTTYSYDSNNNLQSAISSMWNAATSSWINETNYSWNYDNLANLLLHTSQTWNTTSNSWDTLNKQLYYYNCNGVYQGLTTLKKEENSIQIYPNPASSVIHLTSGHSFSTVLISDVSGRQVHSGKASESINIDSLPAGLYILSAINEQGAVINTIKFIKTGS